MTDPPARRSSSDLDAVVGTPGYRELIERLQRRIRESQARAARSLNTELVMLYWSIGRDILAQQQAAGWGDDIVGRIADDLRTDTGSARGFSRRNLFYMRRLAAIWPDPEKVQTLSALIGWSHHQALIDSFGSQPELYGWYAGKAAVGGWSVRHLRAQIHLGLHERQGAALTNFDAALEPVDAERALQATKDPYIFDFLELAEDAHERELEQALIVGDQEFFLDLLLYHHSLRRFVVIELKVGAFEPEYVSKMNRPKSATRSPKISATSPSSRTCVLA